MHSPKVAIIVLHWNRPEETVDCLRSVERLDYPLYEIIVVDNGSTDDAGRFIQQGFPQVLLIRNERNLGFAGGNNVGIAKAVERGADYVFLLNSDALIASDTLAVLVQEAERDELVGIVGPTIFYHQEANEVWKVGGRIDCLGRARDLSSELHRGGRDNAPKEVDFVTGCAILVKRSVLDRVGPMDVRFFAYYEELDWCMRAKKAGFKVLYVPRGEVWHKTEPGSQSNSLRGGYLMTRNRLLLLSKHGFHFPVILLHLAQMLLKELTQRRRLRKAVLKGIHDYFRGEFGEPSIAP